LVKILEVKKMNVTTLKEVANELSFSKSLEEREKLLGVVGALVLRKISLAKASEIMSMDREVFIGLLDGLGFEYSYLAKEDVDIEKNW